VWPPIPGEQQMMVHLDIAVDDLDAGGQFLPRSFDPIGIAVR
jgi:hypothetical protein